MSGIAMITGATGFIGRRLAARLVEEGRPVRVLVRSPDRLADELRRAVDVVVGDLGRSEDLRRSMAGVRSVFHLAGLAAAWARRESDFDVVNVEGVRRLLEAARLEGVERIVHVSTVLTLLGSAARPTPYLASKIRGERLVGRYVAAGGDAVVVHPCRVYGPGPLNDANGVTRLIRTFLRSPLSARLKDDGVRGNYVHVDDVAEGMLLAEGCGRPGASYVLGGENRSIEELLETVADVAGLHRHSLAVPRQAALAMAGAMEFAGRFGAPVPITRAWVRCFLEDQTVDVGPTITALEYHPRPLRAGLAETVEWLRKGGAR